VYRLQPAEAHAKCMNYLSYGLSRRYTDKGFEDKHDLTLRHSISSRSELQLVGQTRFLPGSLDPSPSAMGKWRGPKQFMGTPTNKEAEVHRVETPCQPRIFSGPG
jgi:hypothetical protein